MIARFTFVSKRYGFQAVDGYGRETNGDARHFSGGRLHKNIEPCLICAQAILYARIKKVVYGTGHKEYGDRKTFDILKENSIGKDMEVVEGIDKEKSEEMLKKFFESGTVI